MSNKLAKHQKQKERLTGKQKKVLFWSCFTALSIAFVMVWLNVFLTSNALDRQMEEMVLGEDYDREDVVITDKRSEDASADNAISQNYFFYYHGGKTNEYNKRMQVPESVYTLWKRHITFRICERKRKERFGKRSKRWQTNLWNTQKAESEERSIRIC